jgi:hypothetical protein
MQSLTYVRFGSEALPDPPSLKERFYCHRLPRFGSVSKQHALEETIA